MNANDHDKETQLDEYIDALNAGRPAPQLTDDAELAELFATARDLHRLRAAESARDDVPSRLAAALVRELRANPTHNTRRSESHDTSLFRDASSNGTLRPPEDASAIYAASRRPERARQWTQFAVAAVAFIIVGVILAQIIGSGTDEPSGAVGTDPAKTPTTQMAVLDVTATALSTTPTPTTWATETPVEDSGSAIPTPDETGSYSVMTFEQARELTPFELIEPDTVPQGLTLEGILLNTELDMSTPGSFQAGPVDLVTAFYQNSQSGSVQFWQTTRGCNDPGMVSAVHDDIEIDGRAIRRTLGTNVGGDPLAHYRWQSGEMCYTVFAMLKDGVNEELLAALVASIPLADTEVVPTPAGPQPTTEPVPGETRPVLTLTMDYVTCGDTVEAYGEDFEPGSTVNIYFGGLIGDSFAPLVEGWQVNEDGTFSLSLDYGRFIGECNGGSEEREGSQYKVFAETGTNLSKDGVNVEGPSAVAVLTFSRNVPEVVKQREGLPSCGTEVQRNESLLGPGAGPDQAARECFVSAVERGEPVEFISHRPTIEGDYVTTIYRAGGDVGVEVFYDNTRDRFGSGDWTTATCSGPTLSDEGLEIEFFTCSQTVILAVE